MASLKKIGPLAFLLIFMMIFGGTPAFAKSKEATGWNVSSEKGKEREKYRQKKKKKAAKKKKKEEKKRKKENKKKKKKKNKKKINPSGEIVAPEEPKETVTMQIPQL